MNGRAWRGWLSAGLLAGVLSVSACTADTGDDTAAEPANSVGDDWSWLSERAKDHDHGPIVATPASCAEFGFADLVATRLELAGTPEVKQSSGPKPGQLDCVIDHDEDGRQIAVIGSFDEGASGVDSPGADSTAAPRGKIFESPAARAAGGIAEFEEVSGSTTRRARYHLPGQWISISVTPLLGDALSRDEMTELLDAMLLAAAGRA